MSWGGKDYDNQGKVDDLSKITGNRFKCDDYGDSPTGIGLTGYEVVARRPKSNIPGEIETPEMATRQDEEEEHMAEMRERYGSLWHGSKPPAGEDF